MKSRHLMHVPFAVAVAAGVVLVVLSPPKVVAQYELGDGRGLDNNLQTDGDGYNQRAPTNLGPGYGNAVVTGNVPGLQFFHGDGGYALPGEFSEPLPSDALFRFRARAVLPGLFDEYGDGRVVHRSFSASGADAWNGGMAWPVVAPPGTTVGDTLGAAAAPNDRTGRLLEQPDAAPGGLRLYGRYEPSLEDVPEELNYAPTHLQPYRPAPLPARTAPPPPIPESVRHAMDERFNQLMDGAQQAMDAHDYAKAQNQYRQALQLNSDDPMALVGMIHAQLGAGMVRWAPAMLHRLLAQHPQMIRQRCDYLLPPQDNLDDARDRLRRMLDEPEGYQAALLLAYIGYESDDRALIEQGLDAAEQRRPNDPMIGALRKAWLPLDKDGPE